jgi:PadR family transcriptional regulator PadR
MRPTNKVDLLSGTLDLMVLRMLAALGPFHGWGVARRIEQISGHQLVLNQGTVHASLVRLQKRHLIKGEWGTSENNRKAKFYSLTPSGRKQLEAEAENWQRMVSVIEGILTVCRRK